MATLSATGGSRIVSLSGTGYTGNSAVISVSFSATGRRYNEMRKVPVVAGSISLDIPVPYAGVVTVLVFDPATGTTQITSNSPAVT